MSTWRQLADRVKSENRAGANRDEWDISHEKGTIGANVPTVPLDPSRALIAWRSGLASIDPRQPIAGYEVEVWHSLCEDAAWLLREFGERAARDGWTSADLFGIWPDKPHWGGIADRLTGSRSLVLSADRAHWRSLGQIERYNRGSYPRLALMWERDR